jgi:hypothetical protein
MVVLACRDSPDKVSSTTQHNKTNKQTNRKNKRAGGGAEVVECLPSKDKIMGSIPGASKKEKKITLNSINMYD